MSKKGFKIIHIIHKNLLCRALKHCLILQLTLLMAASACLIGCGKKGPPVPPRQTLTPAVKDLSSNIDGDMFVLTWTIPGKMEDKSAAIKSFIVHRGKQKIQDGDCRNCPVNFKPVAEVSAETKLAAEKMKYAERLEKGFKYVFKVIASSNSGRESIDSNYAEIIY